MGAIGHCQYTWTLFVPGLQQQLGASLARVQSGFSVFVTLQTTSVLALGIFVPQRLHRQAMLTGSLFVGLATLGLSVSHHLIGFYLSCVSLGVGVGCVYNACISLAVRLFPHRRGTVVGFTAAFYGASTLFTVALIDSAIEENGVAFALRALALALTATCVTASILLPAEHWRGQTDDSQDRPQRNADVRLSEAARGWPFWMLYLMLVLITFVGLVITAQLRPLADALSIPGPTLILALQAEDADHASTQDPSGSIRI